MLLLFTKLLQLGLKALTLLSLQCTYHYLSQRVFNLVSQFASQGTYSNPPTVFVTAKHHRKGLKHDAASVWLEDVSAASFKICLRELQNFAGVHEEISVVSFIKDPF